MNIKLNGKLSGVTDANLDNLDDSEKRIYSAALALADELVAELHQRKISRLVHFCQTGRMD